MGAIKMCSSGFLLNAMLLLFAVWGGSCLAIVGGKDIEHGSVGVSSPLVALQMREVQSDGSVRYYKGSAFLMGRNVLLTAGHNIAYVPELNNIEAIFATAPCWGPNVCHERRIKPARAAVHPLFRQIPGGTEYDLALIQLSASAPKEYRPIGLVDETQLLGKKRVQVLGFGTDQPSGSVVPPHFRLRSILLPAVNSSYRIGSRQKFWLDQRRGGICGGDSGGPAVVNVGSSVAAAGLAIHVTYSDGVSHCLTQAAFTDLYFFKDWIHSVLNLWSGL
jgi:hypothetical protein